MDKKSEIFIEKAKAIHGDKYDYSKVEYVSACEKVCIICKKHGEFWQTPQVHLRGCNCPKCGIEAIVSKTRSNSEDFIEKAKAIHGDKYDYSKVNYVNNTTKVCIICPEHGEFWQKPQVHLRGCNCPKCGFNVKPIKTFIKQARAVHGDKYDYSKVEYVNAYTNICIICPTHGEFWQRPYNHLHGNGCPTCKYENNGKTKRKTLDTFIQEANDVHNHKYSYSASTYENTETPISIICPIHGEFFQRPNDHLKGCGCPKCANQQSLAEDEIYSHISNNLGNDSVLKRVKNLLNSRKEIDLFIPSKNIGIEYNGLYWHTEKYGKNNNYHISKMKELNKKGIKLIQIFEDEWEKHKEIVLSKIDHIIGIQNNLPKIFGRKVMIKPINKSDAETFLNKNHIQGFVAATVYLGAFYKEMLVGVASFKEEEKEKWNFTRMATDINFKCSGVCGKLLSFFVKNFKWKEIKTFADRRWTCNIDDNIYVKLGFKLDKILKPNYMYTSKKTRIHKFNFRKQILHKKYGFDLSMTEREMADKLGYSRIWDCGLLKYKLINDNY